MFLALALFMATTQPTLPLERVETQLVAKYGEAERASIHRGLYLLYGASGLQSGHWKIGSAGSVSGSR